MNLDKNLTFQVRFSNRFYIKLDLTYCSIKIHSYFNPELAETYRQGIFNDNVGNFTAEDNFWLKLNFYEFIKCISNY